ncbi:uncharacterized protein BT62DRAFT_1014037 [Guyanagaster necrorhizus]|uniref:Uncharacterized protein n=1 Tax=Guyanagaster necrorhizus TaxID=856835 RepID=A0A9P7VF06_9AGAR|nr:uncharacterized protein BT62DRAFT_1014037 [Guyanagaster necrorhizus MCA 3950]KAG7439362.1 hypothetical protein BT62DRAFT_1014037 [Guyanagaster necrorhizus MCA 3950]
MRNRLDRLDVSFGGTEVRKVLLSIEAVPWRLMFILFPKFVDVRSDFSLSRPLGAVDANRNNRASGFSVTSQASRFVVHDACTMKRSETWLRFLVVAAHPLIRRCMISSKRNMYPRFDESLGGTYHLCKWITLSLSSLGLFNYVAFEKAVVIKEHSIFNINPKAAFQTSGMMPQPCLRIAVWLNAKGTGQGVTFQYPIGLGGGCLLDQSMDRERRTTPFSPSHAHSNHQACHHCLSLLNQARQWILSIALKPSLWAIESGFAIPPRRFPLPKSTPTWHALLTFSLLPNCRVSTHSI